MKNTLALVLGGGRGTRLTPLTSYRSKPAVPLAGKYRLIDIPLSNCINSGLNRIYVLTQFNSVSLHRHIRRTYHFDTFSGGFVELLAAQQTLEHMDWYQGTADAVRQNLRYIQQHGVKHVLILSGDQLYRMNFTDMLATHEANKADVTIAALPVHSREASGLGIMRLNEGGRVEGFLEKPQTHGELSMVRTDPAWIDARGIASGGRDCLASMGIYLFERDVLVALLEKTDSLDFGKEIFPTSIRTHHVQAHLFDGYWEDIGTIRSFYEANLALARSDPPFDFYLEQQPIYSRARFLPPARIGGATVTNSLVADGCIIEDGAAITNSVIGLRCRIGRGARVCDSVVMGTDWYQNDEQLAADRQEGRPHVGIGAGAVVEGAIVDKNCRIGCEVHVALPPDASDRVADRYVIRDGIVVVPRDATLPDGWRLG